MVLKTCSVRCSSTSKLENQEGVAWFDDFEDVAFSGVRLQKRWNGSEDSGKWESLDWMNDSCGH